MSILQFPRLRSFVPVLLTLGFAAPAALAKEKPAVAQAPPHRAENPNQAESRDEPTTEGLSKWHVDDDDPVKSLPTDEQRDHDPLQFGYHLMDLAEKGGVAAKKGDHRAAIRYYGALAKAVPDRSIAVTKMCASYEALGDWEKAVETCRMALGRPGVTVADSTHFVRLLLSKRTPLNPREIEDASAVVAHLQAEASTRRLASELQCEVGARLEDTTRLEACTVTLAATAPDDPKTLSFQWALALARKDFAQARTVIAHARKTEMPPQGIQQMEAATLAAEPMWSKSLRDWRLPAAVSVVMVAGIFIFAARRRTLTAARL
jgi:tetratricopeptide (TPR) repeat protein